MKKFELGQVVATPSVIAALGYWPLELVARHQSGDWGDMDEEDMAANESALDYGSRLFLSYKCGEETVWIITEANRSSTTILLPSDY